MKKEFDVLKIAQLAKLEISDEKAKEFADDFEEITAFASVLAEIPDSALSDTSSTQSLCSFREDTADTFNHNDTLLECAPQNKERYFWVSKVIDEA